MNTNFTTINKWIDFEYKVNNNLITDQSIILALTALFNKFRNLPKDNFILIQFKIIIIFKFRHKCSSITCYC